MESNSEFLARMKAAVKVEQDGWWSLTRFPSNMHRLFALARKGADAEWRSIETAPSEPMRVLLFIPEHYHDDFDGADYGITVGYYGGQNDWRHQGTNHDVFEGEWCAPATHWLPLPPPPKQENENE